jgi:polysaccharide biosynthesis transport protein
MVEGLPLSLNEILLLLWGRKLTICLAALVGGAAFFLLACSLPRLYRSEAEVVIRGETSVAPDPERAFNAAAINDALVRTEKEVMSADGLLMQVANRVSFPPGLDRPVSATGRLAALLRGALPPTVVTNWGLGRLLGAPADPNSAAALKERRLEAIQRAVQLSSEKDSSVIAISATTPDPQFSADIVNTLAATYMEDRLVAQSSVARNAEAALRQRLDQTRSQMAAAEERVASLLQQPALLEEADVPGALRDLALVSSRLAAAKSDLAARRAEDSEIEKMQETARGDPVRLVEMLDPGGSSSDSTASYLRQRYVDREQELAQLGERYGPEHPSVVAAERQMAKLRVGFNAEAQRLIRRRKADLAAAEQTVNMLSSQYSELERRGSGRSASSLALARERERLDSLRSIANKINDQILGLLAKPVDPNARIISPGRVPLRPVFPKKTLFATAGAVMAALCVILLSLGRAYRNSLRPSPAQGAQFLTGPFLGAIPHVNSRRLAPQVLFDKPPSKALGMTAANIHGIALQIEDLIAREGIKVLTVTSGRPSAGKTTVASILAVTLASFGKRVLLVDCDLHRRPSDGLARTIANWHAVSGILPSASAHEAAGVHLLDLASKIADEPLYFLRSAEFSAILERARAAYDIVLCDTPPVLAVPDPLLVARHSDGVLLVAEHEHMGDRAEADEITRRVAVSGKPICGIIVTKTSGESTGYASYSYSYTGYPNLRAA